MSTNLRSKILRSAASTTLAAATLSVASGCLPFESSVDAGVSYSTTPTEWRSDATCIGEENQGTAKELINMNTLMVVVAGGDSPITDRDWESFEAPSGWTKNSTRNLQFDGSCFARSPNERADCQGDACYTVVDVEGHTWIELSQILSVDCIPSGKTCNPMGLGDGELAFIVTRKCHQITFEGDVIMLNGPNGERAVLHASKGDDPPSTNVDLPDGWRLSTQTLDEPLTLVPFGGPGGCYYNIIRDASEQSYHQFEYATAAYP